jgi:SAM-dependent methyltransferase
VSARAATEPVPHCCLCGSARNCTMLTNYDRWHRQPGCFRLVRCRDCGLVRLSPRPSPESLDVYYPDGEYYAFRPGCEPGADRVRRAERLRGALREALLTKLGYPEPFSPRVAQFISAISPPMVVRRAHYDDDGFPTFVAGGRALDIGCGNGDFLRILRRHGWGVFGVDISPAAAAAAARLDIDVHVGPVETLPPGTGPFDLIRMSHVIEHTCDPMTTLRQVAALLTENGSLYIETPNIGAWSFRQCGKYWFPLDTPRHLWLFRLETLTNMLAAAGLRPRRMWTKPCPRLGAWEVTYRREEVRDRVLSPRPVRTVESMPRAVVLGIGGRVASKLRPGAGDTICCWAHLGDPSVSRSRLR